MSNNPSSSRHPGGGARPAQRSDDVDDVTWLDFLRTSGGSVASENNNNNNYTLPDRKRRHAGSSPERRGYPYPVYNPNATGRRPSGLSTVSRPQAPGGSREYAIDLTTPPRPPISQRASDMALPKWQNDADVNRCPVCQTEFHFFYRKHHCRKCGRVVCAACSPHRITIPRQYIVQPPTSSDGEDGPSSPTTSPAGRNLGGGEVVRVCNPCVPDPWTPGTASDGAARPAPENARRRESTGESLIPDRFRYAQFPHTPPRPESNRSRAQTEAANQAFQRPTPLGTQFGIPPPRSRTVRAPAFFLPEYSGPPPGAQNQRPQPHRHTQSNTNTNTGAIPPSTNTPRPPSRPIPVNPSLSPRRREILEEDECPVCGTELPSDENVRMTHIDECILARFPPTPSQRQQLLSGSTPSTSPAANRPRATSYRPRGMAIYRATEKDCLNEDGEGQECVICFEDFQPGDEMGRMECLCKFHRACIRRWWDTKGVGSCPTHQLHD